MQTYTGQCHCGAIGFSVSAEIKDVLECNCSICKATGWQLTFVAADQFELTSGGDALTDYVFAKQHLHHPFCNKCGVHAFSWGDGDDGAKMYSVNTRCLNEFDVSAVDINQYDGASL
ncbi:MAG: hypothetical protein ACI9ON_003387 [Limisphaerales bacterium]|jgi:hypothetical protein